jgi:hypothetical protein
MNSVLALSTIVFNKTTHYLVLTGSVPVDTQFYTLYLAASNKASPLGRPRRRWEDNIKIDFQKLRCRGVEAWTGSIWLRIGTGGGHL